MYRWFPRFFPLLPPSSHDLREWNVELDPVGTPIHVPFVNGKLRIGLHRILIESGIALTQALSASDPRSWYAISRYGLDFAGTAPRLRFYNGATEKDPRLTGVASEEIATGITCYLLREHFNLDHITDAYAAIQSGDLEYVNPPSEKRPDYYCMDSNGDVVIAESKGSTGTRSSITARIDPEGWTQVTNVRPVNHPLRRSCGRIVIGTHLCIDGLHPRTETTTIIKDPDGDAGKNRNPQSDQIIRQSYAKVLRFVGQEGLADLLLAKRSLGDFPNDLYQEIGGVPYVLIGSTPFGDLVGINKYVAETLFSETRFSLIDKLRDILIKYREDRHSLENRGYGLSNGIMILHNGWR